MNPILIGQRNGHPMPSLAALSLLFGVPEEQIAAADPLRLPTAWKIAAGRRRDEATAALGVDHDVLDALQYWAAKDLNTTIVVCGDEALLGLTDGNEI